MEQGEKQTVTKQSSETATNGLPVNDNLEVKVLYKLILGLLLFAAAGFFIYIFITHI